jgi:hypothetical protein
VIGSRRSVWIGAIATVLIYVGAIWLIHEWLVAPRFRERSYALALSFALAQGTAIAVMLVALYVRRFLTLRRARRSERMHAEIEEVLALQLVGIDELSRLRGLLARSRADVANSIEASLATVRGASRERLIATARELGLPDRDDPERLETLFSQATRGNLLNRAVLTEKLEEHAGALAPELISKALASGDKVLIVAALDMVRAWKRVLPIGNIDALFRDEDVTIRARVLAAIPYVTQRSDATILAGLRDAHPDARIAAAESAGRLRVEAASGTLEGMLSDPVPDVAVAAAFALAVLPDGVARLQRHVASPHRAAAAAAFEALEKATLGRLELV